MPELVPDGFVAVRNPTTGRVEHVPSHFLDNPVLLAGREPVPADAPPSEGGSVPSEKWLKADLEKYADDHGIDLAGASTKADMVAAIEAGPTSTDDNESSGSTEPPADGEN